MTRRVDLLTVVGLGALLMPALTMWHEIVGHAATCVALGGHVATVGAFYVNCTRLSEPSMIVVACAGVAMNVVLALIGYRAWSVARRDGARLTWWLIWVSEAFVAAGYFCFSGVTGDGDLGVGTDGALAGVSAPLLVRAAELVVGVAAYVMLVRSGSRALTAMLGGGPDARTSRRRVAHGFYLAAGAGAVLTGLLNPVGIDITIMSAALPALSRSALPIPARERPATSSSVGTGR